MARIIVQILLAIGIIAGGAIGTKKLMSMKKDPPKIERQPPMPFVTVIKVEPEQIPIRITGNGTVQPKQQVQVVPQVAGKVVYVNPKFVNGGFFQANEILVQIEKEDYELAMDRAEASVARAKVNLDQENAEALIAKQEWQEMNPEKEPDSLLVYRVPQIKRAEAEIAAAEAEFNTAKLNFSRTSISLPFDGRVVRETVDVGQYLSPGQSFAMVYGTDVVEIPVPLHDDELAWFDVPQTPEQALVHRVELTKAKVIAEFAGGVHTWEGILTRTEGQVDQANRMVRVMVEVDKPFECTMNPVPLVPGMFVTVNIEGETLSRVYKIPRAALHDNQVWVMVDNRLSIRDVQVARMEKETAYIATGLSAGDEVITSMLDIVTEGMLVRTTSTIEDQSQNGDTETKEETKSTNNL